MNLADKLRSVGIDPDEPGDPAAAFRTLHESIGEEATVIDRYHLEARHRRVAVEKLKQNDRRELTAEVLALRGYEVLGPPSVAGLTVSEYDPAWPRRFDDWRGRLQEAMGSTALAIEHMGSTAVPGLAAKPTVDILVVVPEVDDEGSYVAAIETTGVVLRSRDQVHRYFRPPGESPRVVQIHVCEPTGRWRHDHLLFRDYLRAHRAVAAAYGRLKKDLATEYGNDRVAYTDMKGSFIRRAMRDAELWAGRTGWDPG